MTTRDTESDGGRVPWSGAERGGDPWRSGSGDPAEGHSTRDRRGPAPESGSGGWVASGDGDGAPSVRRRAVLKGLGSGTVVTGLAGCQTDEPGTDPPGRTEPRSPTDGPGRTDEETTTPEDGDGSQTDAKFFESRIDCPQGCGEGECVLIMKFTYDYERAADGTIDVSRFRLRFLERVTTRNCRAEFRGASGTFEFDVEGEQPCSVGPREVGLCECGLKVQFEDLDKGDNQDCICPDPTKTPPPQCSPDPLWIERTGDIESVNIDIEQRATCSCRNDASTFSIDVQVRYQDGEISFGGDTRDS